MKRLSSVFLTLILALSLASPALAVSGSEYFSDIPSDAWYSDYIDICYESGLMNGVGDGRFDPDGTVTIGEAIMVCARIHSYLTDDGTVPELPPEGVRGLLYFTDLDGNRVASFDDLIYWLDGNTTNGYELRLLFKEDAIARLRDEGNPLDTIILVLLLDEEYQFTVNYSDKGIYIVTIPELLDVNLGLALEMSNLKWKIDAFGMHWAAKAYVYLECIARRVSDAKEEQYAALNAAMESEYHESSIFNTKSKSILDEACPRAGLVAFLYLAIPDEFLTEINDVGALPEMDCEALRMLYNAGIIGGVDDRGTLGGLGTLTRAQLAAIIARVVEPSLRLTIAE